MEYDTGSNERGHKVTRRPITWPDERLNQFDWRVDECLDMNLVQSIAESNGHPDWEARVEREVSFYQQKHH